MRKSRLSVGGWPAKSRRMVSFRTCAALFFGILVCTRPALAVIVGGDYASLSDTNVNTSPSPTDDPGFYSVGRVGAASGVYLGNNWVITAAHVTIGNVVFKFWDPGSAQYVTATYQKSSTSGVILTNPSGPGANNNTDLIMFQIDPTTSPYGSPNLPQPLIAPSAPSAAAGNFQGDRVVAVGNGIDRQDSYTYWDNSLPTWQTTTAGSASHTGYLVNGTQQLRWGENLVSQSGIPVNVGTTNNPKYVQSFVTTFDQFQPNSGGTALPSEFQVTNGDSGGGVFLNVNGLWMLSGVIDTIGLLNGQPYPLPATPNLPLTAAFGDTSYMADLSFYRSQILALDPLVGDANGDGFVNGLDISVISAHWLMPGPTGDVNGDGVVNGLDVSVIAAHWSGLPFNPFGGGGSGTGGLGVPEPSAGLLAAAASALLLLGCGRKRFRRGAHILSARR